MGGTSDIPDLSLAHEVVQGSERFVDGDTRPVPMYLVKIDIVRLKPFEGTFTGPYDVQAAVSMFIEASPRNKFVEAPTRAALPKINFCGEQYLMAFFVSLECTTDDTLTLAFGVYIPRIQKIYACIESSVEHVHAFFFGSGISKIICAKA
jgi:hypothetical protein